MASDLHQQLERQHLLAPPEGATNGAAIPAGDGHTPATAAAAKPLAPGSRRIVRTEASVETGGVLALFTLDGTRHPGWQGAFVRSFEGTLGGAAGRWRFDPSGIVVTRVRAGRAADVADAVQAAVDAANGYLAGIADDALAATASAVAADADLQREAVEAAEAMHAALGV